MDTKRRLYAAPRSGRRDRPAFWFSMGALSMAAAVLAAQFGQWIAELIRGN